MTPRKLRRVVLLGATGSIGRTALAVAGRHPERIKIVAAAAGSDVAGLAALARGTGVEELVVADAAELDALRSAAPAGCRVAAGSGAVVDLAARPDVDLVVNGIVGRAGLEASLAAAAAGKTLALANKESLVLAGELLMRTARESGGLVLPVDSEHSGLFQILHGRPREEVARLIVTASGGPFRGWSRDQLETVRPEQALRHPVWPMGPRITVDSATLFNKGLEVIETHHLFDVPMADIAVWVHPQSVVHAVAELVDGTLLSQLSAPDMLLPVQYAMSYPERWESDAPRCALPDWKSLDFEEPDHEAFPALRLAYRAAERGGTAPAALNAADEVAVAAFLDRRLAFPAIVDVLADVLERVSVVPADSLAAIAAADREARARAAEAVGAHAI